MFYQLLSDAIILYWCGEQFNFGLNFIWCMFAFCSCISFLYALSTCDFDYWRRRGIVSPPHTPLVGHILSSILFREQIGICFKKIYNQYPDERFVGTHQFFQRTLVIRDPELIKTICVNDFGHFVDRGFFFNKDVDPLAGSVLFLRGNEWRKLRSKLTPIFSPNKLRNMLPILEETAQEFVKRIQVLVKKDSKREPNNNSAGSPNNTTIVEAESLLGGFTADAIVPCAFGLKSNVMDNPNDPFAVALQAFYEMSFYNILEKTMRQFWPAFVLFFRMRIIPKKTHEFFTRAVNDVLKAREAGGTQSKRGDFIDHMMALRDQEQVNMVVDEKPDADDEVEITDMVISANAFIIFLGGFETTSSTLSFLLLELASHPQVQDKLRAEINEVMRRHNNSISYEMMSELIYTEMVIKETLRLYPPFPNIQRMCTQNYKIPNSDKIIEKGTIVLFPTLGIQRDPKYFKNAEDFIPERFAAEAPAPPPGVYMPFGDGPRYCIGKRFAWLQMKTCLVALMSTCAVSPAPGSAPRCHPHPADPRAAITLHPLRSTLTLHSSPTSCNKTY